MSVSIPSNRVDPTGTATLRRNYARKLRSAFATIITDLRTGIIEDDVFGLQIDALEPPSRVFRFLSDSRQVDEFNEWLEGELADGPLEVISRDENQFIRSAYARGLQDADRAMRQAGLDIESEDVEDLFNQGVHRQTLERLYTRNFENLQGITAEVSRQVSEELSVGLAQGENPRKIARRLSDRVDKIGRTRATTLARTEVINAYSDATLNRYEQMGSTRVTIRAEWLTAGDNRVCPICEALEGNTWTIQEAREETFTFQAGESDPASLSGEYPVKPPSHPNCRCRLIPSVN